MAIATVVGWSLSKHPTRRPADQAPAIAPGEARPPEQLAALPKDYAALPRGVPRLGPPLPGDLGRPMVAAGVASADTPGASTVPAPSQAEAERRQARASRLFAASAAVPQAAREVLTADGPTRAGGHIGEGAPLSANPAIHQLPPGTTIAAALVTGLRSDLPGPVVAQVTEDVFDATTGEVLLIPRGARLVGAYDSKVAFGQDRLFLAWTQLVLPDGTSVPLDKAPGVDGAGYSGLQDGVDRHWRQLAAASLVSLGVAAAGEAGRGQDDAALLRALRTGIADTAAQIGQQVVGRSLAIQPTLTIRPGHPVRVLLTSPLALPAWTVSGRAP